jgi:uncharacterized protein (TIGR02145 family)
MERSIEMRRLQDSVSPGVRRIASFFSHPERSRWGLTGVIAVVALAITLTACGDDSSTSVNDDESSSSKTVALSSSSSQKGTEPAEVSSSSKKNTASSSWSGAIGSSNSKPSSSSQKSDSGTPEQSPGQAESGMTSSSQKAVASSSSEYVPFDHSKTHANASKVGKDAYKQFTDPRNGRSYYYIKIIGEKSSGRKDSVTIMAENLNIGEMVLGKDNQNDDTKIERYCYNNDTTKCDEYGGLYQWAEMMQLPSRCNTESCSDLIEENHRGICPEGWRLMTYADFYIAWHAETNEYGIKGTRSAYGFGGNNYSGLSLTGAGLRRAEGKFNGLKDGAYWLFPEEFEKKKNTHAYAGFVSALDDYAPSRNTNDSKMIGISVRCVKVEQ